MPALQIAWLLKCQTLHKWKYKGGIMAMTEKQVKEFYDNCPDGYEVEETRVFDMVSLQYVTVSMRYIELF